MRYKIECGKHCGVIEARSLGAAWRTLTRNRTQGFADLARFKELDKRSPGKSLWRYIEPASLDAMTEEEENSQWELG
jgi:hypothetical protein